MTKNRRAKKGLISVFAVFFIVILFLVIPLENQKSTESTPLLPYLEDLAIPTGAFGEVIKHDGYTICYSEEHEQPFWAAYVLTPQEAVISVVDRQDNFREDPMVSTGSATLKDYKGSGYDRGHLVPFADLSWSENSGSESFFLSNMSPQTSALNRGRWQELESIVRTFSLDGPICVVTGPVLTDGLFKKIGQSGVSVPNYYYKVILDYCEPELKAIGFIMPNDKCPLSVEEYAVSVDEVEELTGLDFFSLLDDEEENLLESSFDVSKWDFSFFSTKLAQSYGFDIDSVKLSDADTLYTI